MLTISLVPAILSAALLATSKEETRYYLCGVFIDARGWVAATDGHRAFFALCEGAKALADEPAASAHSGASGVIIPRATLEAVLKTRPTELHLRYDAAGWSLVTPHGGFIFKPIDGTFPDWTRVVPSNDGAPEPAHFNPTYVADLGKVAGLLASGRVNKTDNVKFLIHQRGNNPAPITFSDGEGGSRRDVGMVLMPVRAPGHTWRNPLAA